MKMCMHLSVKQRLHAFSSTLRSSIKHSINLKWINFSLMKTWNSNSSCCCCRLSQTVATGFGVSTVGFRFHEPICKRGFNRPQSSSKVTIAAKKCWLTNRHLQGEKPTNKQTKLSAMKLNRMKGNEQWNTTRIEYYSIEIQFNLIWNG